MKKQDLFDCLEIVKSGLSSKEIIEQSDSFVFTNNRVITYNDQLAISHPANFNFSGAVKATELYNLLNKIKKDEIEIEQTNNEILIKSGRTKAGLTLQTNIVLPINEEVSEIGKWKTLPDDFNQMIKFASKVCSDDMSRPVLTAVYINNDTIISSDSYCILNCKLSKSVNIHFLLPGFCVDNIVKLSPIEIAEGNGWIHFKTKKNTIISCRIFEDKYPETTQFMDFKNIAVDLPSSLKDVLERANVFSHREHKIDESVDITLSKKRLTVKAQSDSGWIEESLNLKYDGKEISFRIAPYLLKYILGKTDSCFVGQDRMKFEGENWQYLVMLKSK